MPVRGLYFVPTTSAESSPFSDILTRLTTTFNLTPVQRWSLENRLFRATPQPDPTANQPSSSLATEDKAKPPGQRYLQILALSYLPGRSYVAVTKTHAPSQTRASTPSSSNPGANESNSQPATIVSIASGAQSEEFIQLLMSKFGPMWTHRPSLGVAHGLAYEVGDYGIRVGELRQGTGSAQLVRGVVVQVEWKRGDEGNWEEANGFIRGFWETLGIKGAREILQVPGMGSGDGNVRQWCEVLRLRG